MCQQKVSQDFRQRLLTVRQESSTRQNEKAMKDREDINNRQFPPESTRTISQTRLFIVNKTPCVSIYRVKYGRIMAVLL